MDAAVDRYDRLEGWLTPFRFLFTRPTWQRLLVLATGAILTTHRRTVSAALRVTGRGEDAGFSRYHDVLSRSRWSALAAARLLLVCLVATFVPAGPVVIGLDDTIERRWGTKTRHGGIYRDPVRSSHTQSERGGPNLHAKVTRITTFACNGYNETSKMTKVSKNTVHFNFIHQAGIGPSWGRACLSMVA